MINTFLYYLKFYHDVLNGGGTFSQEELLEEFIYIEGEEKTQQLKLEADLIYKELQKQDWEIDHSILKVCDKYSKNHIKCILSIILN